MTSKSQSTIPRSMKAIAIDKPGGPEALTLSERSSPSPAAGEVLIKVAAAGVNRPDILQRQGNYPPPPGASDIPGLEIAGEIIALGDHVEALSLGDRVTALVTGGGYAEYCTAPAGQCLPIPSGLSLTEAAALPETFFTVWTNVFDRCRLQAGESFLVHGGSSGIGTTAIQMARAMGARVFATAGSDKKCNACTELGAIAAINYKNEDFVTAVKEKNDGIGVDVILDMVGGDYIARNVKLLAPDGRLCYIAFLGGSKVELDFLPIMLKRITLTGSTLRARDVAFKSAIADNLKSKVWPKIENGEIRPMISATFPLGKADEAHALMESSTHIGKIVLLCDETLQ
ncbi:MAG: NAD(P)H-quinone oxidoreductase [Kiloniellales bacterium]|nr:NAD(P)H-quinone oxidoreductase [Kiloniellales bacterium]